MGALGSPWDCSLMGPSACFTVRGKPIYSVVPMISVWFYSTTPFCITVT